MSTMTLVEPTVLEKRSFVDTPQPMAGTVYTETVIFSPPVAFVKDAPYQIAIIDLDEGGRLTVRIHGDDVLIGDRVELMQYRTGIPFFRKVL